MVEDCFQPTKRPVKAFSKASLDRTYLLALDEENALFCECRYTEEKFDESQLKDMQNASLSIIRPNKFYTIFSKNGVTDGVKKLITKNKAYSVVTADDLF